MESAGDFITFGRLYNLERATLVFETLKGAANKDERFILQETLSSI